MPQWKQPAVPRSVVQVLPVDHQGNMLLLHRSNTVRSARNVWSIPTGTQEVGESLQDTIVREIQEEFNLTPLLMSLIGIYENIAGDKSYCSLCNVESGLTHETHCPLHESEPSQPYPEQYHWVINFYVIFVENITKDMINKEPDKHDQVATIPYASFLDPSFFTTYNFHPTLTAFLTQHKEAICYHIQSTLEPLVTSIIDAQQTLNVLLQE